MSVATGTSQHGPCDVQRHPQKHRGGALRSLALVLSLSLSLLPLKTGRPLAIGLSTAELSLLQHDGPPLEDCKAQCHGECVQKCAVRRSSGISAIYILTDALSLQVSRSRTFTAATRARSSEKRPRTVEEDRVGSLSCL